MARMRLRDVELATRSSLRAFRERFRSSTTTEGVIIANAGDEEWAQKVVDGFDPSGKALAKWLRG